jgi:hypothetical protein
VPLHLNIKAYPAPRLSVHATKSRCAQVGVKVADPLSVFPVPHAEERGNEISLGGEEVEIAVAGLDRTVQTVGETMERQRGHLEWIRAQREETGKQLLASVEHVPARHPRLRPEDVIDQHHIDRHIVRYTCSAARTRAHASKVAEGRNARARGQDGRGGGGHQSKAAQRGAAKGRAHGTQDDDV